MRKRRKFNFAPAIDLEPDAEKALSLLAGMKEGAVGVRASYVPVKVDMRFTFDFIFDSEKQHRFDEIIPLQGAVRTLLVGARTGRVFFVVRSCFCYHFFWFPGVHFVCNGFL